MNSQYVLALIFLMTIRYLLIANPDGGFKPRRRLIKGLNIFLGGVTCITPYHINILHNLQPKTKNQKLLKIPFL